MLRSEPATIEIAQAPRRANHPFAVTNVMHQLSDHQEPGIGFERGPRLWIKAIRRFHEADRSDLLEIRLVDTGARKSPCGSHAEVPVLRYDVVAR